MTALGAEFTLQRIAQKACKTAELGTNTQIPKNQQIQNTKSHTQNIYTGQLKVYITKDCAKRHARMVRWARKRENKTVEFAKKLLGHK